MKFTYWQGDDHRLIRKAVKHWVKPFPEFKVIGDRDVEPLVEKYFPSYLDLYRKIRIPACKSDIARLFMLYENGGLYVDVHVGMRSVKGVQVAIDDLKRFELILYDRYAPADRSFVVRPINTFLISRQKSDILFEWIARALENVRKQHQREQSGRYADYNIWRMTGPGLIDGVILGGSLLRLFNGKQKLKKEYKGRIRIVPEVDAPFVRNMYRRYQKPGMHWSERQKHELLFERDEGASAAPADATA